MDQNELRESVGRIEIAPEVLTTIARHVTLSVEGVSKLATVPPDVSRIFSRAVRDQGVLLNYSNSELAFDIYVLVDPHVSVMDTSRAIQGAIVEAIDKMVGLPVKSVNVHVEDVVYAFDEPA
jgi:uncharacterized alkaline shock family protein YloU